MVEETLGAAFWAAFHANQPPKIGGEIPELLLTVGGELAVVGVRLALRLLLACDIGFLPSFGGSPRSVSLIFARQREEQLHMTKHSTEHPSFAEKKIKFLIRSADAKRRLGHNSSMSDLARRIGVPYETLRDQARSGFIRPDMEQRLAAALNFNVEWAEWKTGSVEEFEGRYIQENRAQTSQTTRRTDVRISRGDRIEPIPSDVVGLAALEIDGCQFGLGTAAIEVQLSCGKAYLAGAWVTIKSGRLEMKCNPAVITRDTYSRWIKAGKEVKGSDGLVRIFFEAATRSSPGWRLCSASPSIGNVSLDADFASVEELAPGDEITLQFGTWLSDIEEDPNLSADEDGLSLVDVEGSTVEPSTRGISISKFRVLAALRKKLLSPDRNGFVVLASHTLKIVRGDQ